MAALKDLTAPLSRPLSIACLDKGDEKPSLPLVPNPNLSLQNASPKKDGCWVLNTKSSTGGFGFRMTAEGDDKERVSLTTDHCGTPIGQSRSSKSERY